MYYLPSGRYSIPFPCYFSLTNSPSLKNININLYFFGK
jgi:hypothetical protein